MPPTAIAAIPAVKIPATKPAVRKPLWSDAEDSDDEPIRSVPTPTAAKPQTTNLDQRTTAPKPTQEKKIPIPQKIKDPDEWMEFGWNGWTKVYRSPNKRKLAEEEAKKAALNRPICPPDLNQVYVRKRQKLNLSLADLEEKDDDDEWKEDDIDGKKNKKRRFTTTVSGGRDLVKETARQWGRDYDDVGSHIGETVKSRTRKAAPKTIIDFD